MSGRPLVFLDVLFAGSQRAGDLSSIRLGAVSSLRGRSHIQDISRASASPVATRHNQRRRRRRFALHRSIALINWLGRCAPSLQPGDRRQLDRPPSGAQQSDDQSIDRSHSDARQKSRRRRRRPTETFPLICFRHCYCRASSNLHWRQLITKTERAAEDWSACDGARPPP